MIFEHTLEDKGQYSLIHFKGTLMEANQANELLESIDDKIIDKKPNFIIDLSGVEHMNSTGLNLLINILTRSRNAGGDTVITNIPDKINKLIVIAKLNTVFAAAKNLEEAVEVLNREESWL